MIKPGICSISFRKLAPEDVVDLARRSGLAGIEWGGDVHVPHGDIAAAQRAAKTSREAGLDCPSYGSYYRAGVSEPEGLRFQDVLRSAEVLGAETVRVWAGRCNFEAAHEDTVSAVVEDSRRIADLAAAAGKTISFEYHNNTFTNSDANARNFAGMVEHEAIRFYWQQPLGESVEKCREGIRALLDRISNVHVFQWEEQRNEDGSVRVDRGLLEQGRENWLQFLGVLAGAGREHWAHLEFARDDDPVNAQKDASTLLALIREAEAA